MTRDELNRRRMMFQIYANRNKMPQLQKNDNEEPVAHSATNDFLEYRKKVAAGTRMQRENNKSNLFNVTAANEQYHQDLMDQNIIIHAGMNNQYIAKLDDFYGKGKPRYFYDQTEWDNYRKTANRNSALNNMQSRREEAIKEGWKSQQDSAKNKDLANKAQEAFTKSSADYKNKDLVNKAQEAFNNTDAANIEYRTTDAKNKELLTRNQKNKENAIKRSNPEYQKELEKAKSIKEDKDRWGAYSESDLKEISKDKRFSNIKTEDDAVNYPGGVEKLYNDIEAALEEKYPGKKKNYEASKNAGADRAKKESAVEKEKEAKVADRAKKLEEQQNKKEEAAKSGTKTTESYTEQVKRNTDFAKDLASHNEDGSLDKGGKDYVNWVKEESLKNLDSPEFYQIKKDVVKDAKKPGATVKDLANKYGLEEAYINYLVFNATGKNIPEDKNHLDARRTTNALYNKWSKEGAINRSKKSTKHSSLEDGITTSDDITPDQEYLNFRARVEAGMKHFGTTRGLMSVPVNQALKNGESLSHAGYKPAGTHEYVAKIDNAFGPGKHRYFYTKEEWDNYNNYKRNEDYAKNAGANKAKKDEWNAASKKTGLSYEKGTNKEWDNMLKNDQKALDEAFWQGKGDLKKAQQKVEKYEHNMESGKDFYVDDNGNAKLGDNYSFKMSDNHYVGQEPEWTAPGLKDPNEHEWSDEDVKKVAEYNQPIIDHCVEFYEKYVLENDETLDSGRKKFTAWDVEHEIQDYLNRVIPRAFPEYRDEERSAGYFRSVPNNAGYALKHVLWQLIKNRIDSEKKAWDRTHKK